MGGNSNDILFVFYYVISDVYNIYWNLKYGLVVRVEWVEF